MPVERFERGLQLHGEAQRVERLRLAPPPLRHLPPDVLPKVAELRHLAVRDVVRHRHPRQLDDAAFDGVHQREVAHRPREQRPLGVAGPAQEEGGGGEVDDAPHAQRAGGGVEAGHPQPGRLAVLLRLLAVVAGQGAFLAALPPASRAAAGIGILVRGLLAVAVVRLVVQDQDVLHPHQLRHHPPEHLPFAFEGPDPGPRTPPFQQRPTALRQRHRLAPPEGVVVGDDDPGPPEVAEHVRRDQLAAAVVAVRVVRLQHPQPVADGQAGGDDEEPAPEAPAAGPAHRVDRLPGDDHRHHGGLAGPGRQLQGQPRQPRVGPGVGRFEVVEERPLAPAPPRRDLREPDQRLDRLDLAEEGPDAAEAVVAPVAQQAGRLRGDLPVARIRQRPPPVHVAAQLVDDGRRVVPLGLRGDPGAVPELQRVLGAGGLACPRFRDGGDELGPPAPVDEPVGRLPLRVELPMAGGVLVRGVDDRLGEEAVRHGWLRLPHCLLPAGPGPGVWGSGLRVPVSEVQVSGSGFQIPESRFRLPAYRTRTAPAPGPVFVVAGTLSGLIM